MRIWILNLFEIEASQREKSESIKSTKFLDPGKAKDQVNRGPFAALSLFFASFGKISMDGEVGDWNGNSMDTG